MTLKPEDHALITRLVARQPNLMLRGHEGYYRHEDIIEAIQLIGRLAAAREEGRAPASGDLREKVARVIRAYDEGLNYDLTRDDGTILMEREDFVAILNLIGGDGWKLVPVEPTEDMLKAPDDSGVGLYSREVFADIYRAMIAASPPPPVTP